MSLRKKEVVTLWQPGGDIVTGSIANGGSYWFRPETVGTDSDLSTNDGTIRTDAWMAIDTHGADALAIQIGTKVSAVTGGSVWDGAACRVWAFGALHVGPEPHDRPPIIENAYTIAGDPDTDLAAIAVLASYWPGTGGFLGTYTGAGVDMVDNVVLLGDGTAVAAADTTLTTFWLGKSQTNDDRGQAANSHAPPRISGIGKVWLAIQMVPSESGTNISALTLTADSSILAILYDEYRKAIPYTVRPRQELRQAVPKI